LSCESPHLPTHHHTSPLHHAHPQIEKHAQHILDTPELHPLLSAAELSHAERYAKLIATHFQHSVLDSLPEWLRRMDDTNNDGVSMGGFQEAKRRGRRSTMSRSRKIVADRCRLLLLLLLLAPLVSADTR